MKFCSVICTTQIPGIEHKLRTMRIYTLQCDRWPALCDSLESMDRSAQKQTNCLSVTHITWKIFNCIFFHRQRGPTRCALRVASHPSRSFVFDGSCSRTNGDIANGRATSTRPITNHSRGTIKQNRGKKFPSKVSRFICTS